WVLAISGRADTVTHRIHVASLQVPAGIAVNTATNTVYAADSNTSMVSVINGHMNKLSRTIKVVGGPGGITVDAKRNVIYVSEGDATVSVINGRTSRVTAVIKAGYGLLEGIAVNPQAKTVFVAGSNTDTVKLISTRTHAVKTITSSTFGAPDSASVDAKTDTAYVANYLGSVSVLVPCPKSSEDKPG
ncbi:MAG: YncE family protein, partial [Streptosporangiaceae bacterium]